MVELACIHEQCRSIIVRRNQLIDEGQMIHDNLRDLPEDPNGGLDTMVP